jgi:hypothetical protein
MPRAPEGDDYAQGYQIGEAIAYLLGAPPVRSEPCLDQVADFLGVMWHTMNGAERLNGAYWWRNGFAEGWRAACRPLSGDKAGAE